MYNLKHTESATNMYNNANFICLGLTGARTLAIGSFYVMPQNSVGTHATMEATIKTVLIKCNSDILCYRYI